MLADRPRRACVFVADDAGVSVARNAGIIDACTVGVVREISVLANGEALDDLVARLGDLRPSDRPGIGLHVNLTSGPALTGSSRDLTTDDGMFCGDKCAFWERAISGELSVDAVEREITAQLTRLDDLGLTPRRFDGHNHVHVLPAVRIALRRVLAARPGIGWTRLGAPTVVGAARFPTAALGGLPGFERHLTDTGAEFGGACGSADSLVGLDLLHGYDVDALLERMAVADGAVVEVMCHPGRPGPEPTPFGADDSRERERQTLTDPRLPGELAALGFVVGRFSDAV